jgi:hypothetical protein
MCVGVCGGLRARRCVSFEAGRRGQRREFFDPSRHLFRVHLSGSPAVVSLMAVRMVCAVLGV